MSTSIPAVTAAIPKAAALRLRSTFAALRHRNYRLFLIGQFISLCGTLMQQVALGWLVLELTNSPFAVGLVTSLGSLPILLLTLYGGVVADRVDKRLAERVACGTRRRVVILLAAPSLPADEPKHCGGGHSQNRDCSPHAPGRTPVLHL